MASDAKACFPSKVEYRAVIRYLYLKGKTGMEIHGELADVYGSSAPSNVQVKFWVGNSNAVECLKKMKPGLDAHLMPPTKKCVRKFRIWYTLIGEFRWKKQHRHLGISHGSVSTILHDRLGMRKLTAPLVPKSLSNEQMATRASVCSALLKRFRSKDNFLLLLVTVDETWVHYYEPENKAQSSVGRAWVPEAKEVQDATICWKGDGHSTLGRKRHYYVGLFTQEKYNNWSVLCKLVRPAENCHP